GDLPDDAVLAASVWDTFLPEWQEVPARAETLELTAMLPREVARRHRGDHLRFYLGEALLSEESIEADDSGSLGLLRVSTTVSRAALTENTETARAELVTSDGATRSLGAATVRLQPAETAWKQFEVPSQSIVAYDVFQDNQDLRIVTIV